MKTHLWARSCQDSQTLFMITVGVKQTRCDQSADFQLYFKRLTEKDCTFFTVFLTSVAVKGFSSPRKGNCHHSLELSPMVFQAFQCSPVFSSFLRVCPAGDLATPLSYIYVVLSAWWFTKWQLYTWNQLQTCFICLKVTKEWTKYYWASKSEGTFLKMFVIPNFLWNPLK